MKKIGKILLLLLLITGLVLSATACGGELDDPENGLEEDNDSAKEESEDEESEDDRYKEEEDMGSKEVEGNYFTMDVEKDQALSNWIDTKKSDAGEFQNPENGKIYLITAGEKNTGGYSIKITEEKLEGEELILIYNVRAPGPDEIVTQAITYPYLLIELSEEVEHVNFIKE